MENDFSPAIIDVGSYLIRVGFAEPEVSNWRSHFKSKQLGDVMLPDNCLSLENPFIDRWERLVHRIYREELKVSSDDRPLLLTFPEVSNPLSNKSNILVGNNVGTDVGQSSLNHKQFPFDSSRDAFDFRQRQAQILFEKFQVPYCRMDSSAQLALRSQRLETGIVVDLGHTQSTVCSILDSHVIKESVHVNRALHGLAIENWLANFLRDIGMQRFGLTLMSRSLKEGVAYVMSLMSHSYGHCIGDLSCSTLTGSIEDIFLQRYLLMSRIELLQDDHDVMNLVGECMARYYIAPRKTVSTEVLASFFQSNPFPGSDGISIGNELWMCADLLFSDNQKQEVPRKGKIHQTLNLKARQAALADGAKIKVIKEIDINDNSKLQFMIRDALLELDSVLSSSSFPRESILADEPIPILLCGGTSLLPGLKTRIETELSRLHCRRKFRVTAPNERQDLTYKGAWDLCQNGDFGKTFVSRSTYAELGIACMCL